MSKQKEQEKQQPKTPLGITASPTTPPLVTHEQFFNLMRIAEAFNNLIFHIKQENLQADTIRYYFEEDLVDAVDKDGNPIMIKDKAGNDVQQKSLNPEFWNTTVAESK